MSWNLPLQLSKLVRNPYNVNMNFLQNVDVSGNLKVYGSADISGGIVVFMDLSDVLLDGNDASGQNIVGVGTYSGINADLSGDLDVSGNTTIYGNTDIYGNFGASENTIGERIINSTSNTFTVQDYAGNWAIRVGDGTTNPATARDVLLCASAGQVNVGIDPTYSTSLNVYGLTETTDMSVNNNLDVSGNAFIYGFTTVDNDLSVNNNLDVSGNTTIYGYTRIYNDMSVNGFIDVSGSVNIFTDCDVSQNFTVFGQTNCEDNLNVKGNCDISGNIGFCNDIATNSFTSTGTSNLGATTINTSLTFSGYTTGDMIQSNSSGVMQKLPIGSNGDFLTVVGGVASWGAYTPTTETLQQTLTAGNDANNLNITNLADLSVNRVFTNELISRDNTGGTGEITIAGVEFYSNPAGSNGSVNANSYIVRGLAANRGPMNSSNVMTKFGILGFADSATTENYMVLIPFNGGAEVGRGNVILDQNVSLTVQHFTRVPKHYDESYYGLILSSEKKYINKPKISEALVYCKVCEKEKDKNVYGVYSNYDFITRYTQNEKNETVYRKNTPQETEEDKIGTSSSGGEGMIWVCNINGNIEAGDYIHSSRIAGIGCRQLDDLRWNYTIFKSSVDCNFTNENYQYPYCVLVDDGKSRVWVDEDDPSKGFKYEYLTYESKVYDLNISEDKYQIVDSDKVILEYSFDFKNKDSELVGKTYKAKLIGGIYCN